MQTQFVRENMNQYLVIERDGAWEDSYEEKLFGVAKVPYFMPYDIRQVNGSAAFYYHMSFKTSLKQAFECVEFTVKKVDNIIRSIVGVLETCDEFLVDSSNVLFDSEYVFFDVDTGRLKFCYYYDKSYGMTLKELVMEILQHIDKRNEQGSVRLLKFYHLLTDPDVSPDRLNAFIGDRNSIEQTDNAMVKKDENVILKEEVDDGCQEREKETNKEFGSKKRRRKKVTNILKILMGVAAIADIVLFFGLLCNILTYEKMGYLFIGMAILIGLFIIYMHFEPEESPDDIMNEYSKSLKDSKNERIDHNIFEYQEETVGFMPDYDGATVLLNMDCEDKVSCVQEEYNERLYLEAAIKDKYLPIHINKKSVLLGSMQGSCDYILEEKGISRLHAKLLDKEDGMFIMDMNSTNGTYLNGEMLSAGREYQLKAGDLVTLADVQYYVMQEGTQ